MKLLDCLLLCLLDEFYDTEFWNVNQMLKEAMAMRSTSDNMLPKSEISRGRFCTPVNKYYRAVFGNSYTHHVIYNLLNLFELYLTLLLLIKLIVRIMKLLERDK